MVAANFSKINCCTFALRNKKFTCSCVILSPDGSDIWRKRRRIVHDGRLDGQIIARDDIGFDCAEPALVLWEGAGPSLLLGWFHALVKYLVSECNSFHKCALPCPYVIETQFFIRASCADQVFAVNAAMRAVQFRSTIIGEGKMTISLLIQGERHFLRFFLLFQEFSFDVNSWGSSVWLCWNSLIIMVQVATPHTVHQYRYDLSHHTVLLLSTSAALLTKRRFSIGHRAHHTCSTVTTFTPQACITSASCLLFHLLLSRFRLKNWSSSRITRDSPFRPNNLFLIQVWIRSFLGRWSPLSSTVQRPCQTAQGHLVPPPSVSPFMLLSHKSTIHLKAINRGIMFRASTCHGLSQLNSLLVACCAFLFWSQLFNDQVCSAYIWINFAQVLWYRGFNLSSLFHVMHVSSF